MIDADHLREHVVRPALVAVELHSDAAENLVMGTAAQESHLEYLVQLEGGPAQGLFQMEPVTYDDIWTNYLQHRNAIAFRIRRAIYTSDGVPPVRRLVWDLRFAAIMCRIHYLRKKEPLPDANDVWALGRYWKEHYNTHMGKGTVQEFVDNYRRVS